MEKGYVIVRRGVIKGEVVDERILGITDSLDKAKIFLRAKAKELYMNTGKTAQYTEMFDGTHFEFNTLTGVTKQYGMVFTIIETNMI